MIAKVLIDTSVTTLNRIYDYLIPKELEKDAKIGKRVHINFGNGKGQEKEGIIVKLEEEDLNIKDNENVLEEKKYKLKEITSILDEESYLNETSLKLAKWIAKMYFCNVYDAMKIMLPPTTADKFEIKTLKGKQAKIVCLNASIDFIEGKIESGEIKSAKQIKLLKYLYENEYIYLDDAIKTLGISRSVITTLEKNSLVMLDNIDIELEDFTNVQRSEKMMPTDEQALAINGIIDSINSHKYTPILLKGVTGSGKTEVYLQAIEECIRLGKTAIVLVPEIALTYQTKKRFISRFGDTVSVLHSKMTILEKQTQIKRIIQGKSKIVIGPRSALFVPIKDLGLIIIDEEHDPSFVSQTTPKYSAKEVAAYLAYLHNAVLVLGSATPEIATMYKAKCGMYKLYELNKRPNTFLMPKVETVDMKQEALMGNTGKLSSKLISSIEEEVKKGHQAFIFLNRRGYASFVICKSCGKVLKCQNCDVGLTYHKKIDLLLCHYCSHAEKLNAKCPYCGGNSLELGGIGTEAIEQELKEKLPYITTLRLDADTTVKRGSHEEILDRFVKENVNVLIGTQMISKGHDIPNVTLVGIVLADGALGGGSFLSTERGFSNLLQVSGRAGRGSIPGKVIAQCIDTKNYCIEPLIHQSYDEYYKEEIEFRKSALYPPFKDMVLIELTSAFKMSLENEANKVYELLRKKAGGAWDITSPKAPYISKVNNKFFMQMIIKTKLDDKIYNMLYEFMQEYGKIKQRNVNISIVRNPIYI